MIDLESIWQTVKTQAERVQAKTLRELFTEDDSRFEQFSLKLDDMLIDFSKECIDQQALQSLFALARSAAVETSRDWMFAGVKINPTENRAVLHTALRAAGDTPLMLDGEDVMPDVCNVRDRFLGFAEALRKGEYTTVDGKPFSDVVSIGIGGSDLGPAMVTQALAPWHDGPRVHFVSNVDGAHLFDTLQKLEARSTLLIIASKTFTTLETMTNAQTARDWLAQSLGADQAGAHMAAVSTNLEATKAFGIDDSRVFGFWDWVGGRYSVWSAIGLPVAIAIGEKGFRDFLAGAAAMDSHFQMAPVEQNLPVMLALIGIWRRNLMDLPSIALIPYDQRLARFPAFIQQLDMESNGKQTRRDGNAINRASGPVVWGEAGTNAQHSFFQLIHQGSDRIPVDFLIAAQPAGCADAQHWLHKHHDLLLANALAQANALAFGRSEAEARVEMQQAGLAQQDIDRLAPHKTFPGNRPSTVISYRTLDPFTLGRLIALYEHKVFVQGVIWGVNSFDQWGVELGKVLAGSITPAVQGSTSEATFDSSTNGLLGHIHQLRAQENQQ